MDIFGVLLPVMLVKVSASTCAGMEEGEPPTMPDSLVCSKPAFMGIASPCSVLAIDPANCSGLAPPPNCETNG